MNRRTGGRGRTERAAIWMMGISLLCVAGTVALWAGCTVTTKNYKLLSLLFDGVPDPSLPAGAVGASGEGAVPVFVVVHKPYADENCDACHVTRYRPSRTDSSVCLKCHEGTPNEFPYMHGPVAASGCLWCHSPHEAAYPSLLRDQDRTLCAQCHEANMLGTARVAAHADASRACLECHTGHGGQARYMLKPGVSADTPAPQGAPPGTPADAK